MRHGPSRRHDGAYKPSAEIHAAQDVKIEEHGRVEDPTRTAGISRFDMDVFTWMAEHVAIRGLDDGSCDEAAHYHDPLPATVTSEPFPGYFLPPAAPPRRQQARRRIECLMAAHRQARSQVQRQLEGLRGRQSTTAEETAALEAQLERLGAYPQPMAGNTDDAWLRMKECVFLLALPASHMMAPLVIRPMAWQAGRHVRVWGVKGGEVPGM